MHLDFILSQVVTLSFPHWLRPDISHSRLASLKRIDMKEMKRRAQSLQSETVAKHLCKQRSYGELNICTKFLQSGGDKNILIPCFKYIL